MIKNTFNKKKRHVDKAYTYMHRYKDNCFMFHIAWQSNNNDATICKIFLNKSMKDVFFSYSASSDGNVM